ncbi:MAG: 5-(hydroxymethyl)furfural/furfural oxidase [Gammaproteobacteria bacterium]|jgi:5-(hydroxymethyl)furfural/furfural oxidase
MNYDYIIVGGGSAGSVMANRLSARSANQVLLLEAGPDTPHGKVPEAILDSYPGKAYLDERFHWTELKVTTEVISHNAPPDQDRPPLRKYEQARVLGGGSSINGQMANRGAPSDYAEWEARGAKGWGWDQVFPYFKKVERDMDVDDEWHGQSGRIPVRRIMPDAWPAFSTSIGKAFAEAGYDFLPDQNGEFRDGYFPITISNAYEQRVSAAIGYLDPGTRLRKNLTISTDTQVQSLIFEGNQCIGVNAQVGGKDIPFRGTEIILSCGAIHSPAHLLRAGIGPALTLQDMGIEVRANVPGVGQRLMDHPSIALASFVKPHARHSEFTRRHLHVGLRYSSGISDAPQGDMFVAVAARSAWHAVGEQIGSMILFVNRTYSETGQVTLRSADWRDEPNVDFNLLSDRRDLERLMHGFRHLAGIMASDVMRETSSNPFPASYGDKVKQVGMVTRKNALMTGVMAKLLDGPAALRNYLFEKFITDGLDIKQMMEDDEAMEAFARKAAVGVWHASCTCRMGADNDPMAVTNNAGKVRGVQGLRVVDASVFPVVPCANTNFPTLMVAEKISDMILDGK